MLEDRGFVESLDERSAVITRGDYAVVFELHECLLNGDTTYAQPERDLIAVDAVAAAQLPGQYQVEDVVNNLVFFFDPVFLRHQSLSTHAPVISGRSFSRLGARVEVFRR